MDEEKIKELIKQYIKDNLDIVITSTSAYNYEANCSIPSSINVGIYICGEVVCEKSEYF